MPSRTKTAVNEEFLEDSVTLRGVTYRFRELSGERYEEMLKEAEGPDGTADLSTVLRLMIPESLIDPKLTTEQIYRKPLPVLTAIQNHVNRMHFRSEPEETPGDEDGEPQGNDSEGETS